MTVDALPQLRVQAAYVAAEHTAMSMAADLPQHMTRGIVEAALEAFAGEGVKRWGHSCPYCHMELKTVGASPHQYWTCECGRSWSFHDPVPLLLEFQPTGG